MARSLIMLESFVGIMYIALLVSRLISLTAIARRDRRRSVFALRTRAAGR